MIYFRESCKCNGSLDTCYNIELVKKSNRFILEYPCIPRGSNILSRFIQGIDESEFADIHNKCIDDYNEHVEKYIQAGFTRKKCLKISSMYR
jgi:hypothetical protein